MPDDLHSLLVASLTARLERARAALNAPSDPGTIHDLPTGHGPWAEFDRHNDPATEIRRVEALLRVVNFAAKLPSLQWLLRDLAAGEGIEVGTADG